MHDSPFKVKTACSKKTNNFISLLLDGPAVSLVPSPIVIKQIERIKNST